MDYENLTMSDGMSEYWRNKKAQEQHNRVVQEFFLFVRCLLDNRQSIRLMIEEMTIKVAELEKAININENT